MTPSTIAVVGRPRGIRDRGLLLWVLALACGGGDGSSPTDPPEDGPPDPPPGDVRTATLTVRGVIDGEDPEVAEELGFASALPGAVVRIQRSGSSTTMTATTDADGIARFEELLEGNYSISLLRTLDAQEVASLSVDNRDVTAFGGARLVQGQPPGREVTITAAAGRRGSLVISEHYFSQIFIPGSTGYWFSGFLELYNNSDTTIFLDGKHVGAGWSWFIDEGQWPCSSNFNDMRFDPVGVWARFIYRIPGSGRTHPLEPGQTAVLAIDGIDHVPLIQGGLDLTGADFEFLGRSDVDNPGIPNLEPVGPGIDTGGHGLIFGSISEVPFVVDRFDVETLPRRVVTAASDVEWVRVPADAILDVGHFLWLEGNSTPHCVAVVDPSFDRGAADIPPDALASLSRRVLFELPDGRPVLQRMKTSARDFEPGGRTPGTVR